MTCPLCGRRPARRNCPARRTTICPTCCATKRLREIDCPDDCQYLASARAHPPAVVQRQRERDVALLVGLVEGLSTPQFELFSVLTAELRRYRQGSSPRLTDADVADAARAQASTLETAAKGILYEHPAASLPAQRLTRLFRELLDELEKRQPRPPREPAVVFRRLEAGVRTVVAAGDSSDSPFLDTLDRLATASEESSSRRGSLEPDDRTGVHRAQGVRSDRPATAGPPRIILP